MTSVWSKQAQSAKNKRMEIESQAWGTPTDFDRLKGLVDAKRNPWNEWKCWKKKHYMGSDTASWRVGGWKQSCPSEDDSKRIERERGGGGRSVVWFSRDFLSLKIVTTTDIHRFECLCMHASIHIWMAYGLCIYYRHTHRFSTHRNADIHTHSA